MATSSWSSGNAHDSDANFRIWGKELSDKLQAMSGLVKTSDTGQINWGTATRTINTNTGYEIYYLNDSLHSTAPIYIKMYYGTANSITYPRIQIEIGTGSNGSGTITGIGAGQVHTTCQQNSGGSAIAQPSYLCVTAGFMGLVWKQANYGGGGFFFARTVDSTGALTADGAFCMVRGPGINPVGGIKCLRFAATAASYPATGYSNSGSSIIPADVTVAQNNDEYFWIGYGAYPDVRPHTQFGGVRRLGHVDGATFTLTPFGSTPRTYIKVSETLLGYPASGTTTASYAILWE